MRPENTVIETPSVVLPPRVMTSEELETSLAPVYDRIGLRVGRLELMTGIRERRFWNEGMLPSEGAIQAGRLALESNGILPDCVDCLINCSVSRDCVEPATSTFVHHALGLSPHALNFDISNACLGILTGITTATAMIESGAIQTALLVSSENSWPLIKNTIRHLNDGEFTRQSIKPHFASLTIGSCATAVVVRKAALSSFGHRVLGIMNCSDTSHNELCQGDTSGGMTSSAQPLMQTDSPVLLQCGVALARTMWDGLKQMTGWEDGTPDRICTHQVGKGHRQLLYETLNLDLGKDYSTYPFLGNCGSASLPATLGLAAENGLLEQGDNVAMLGIGSGINCCGIALKW